MMGAGAEFACGMNDGTASIYTFRVSEAGEPEAKKTSSPLFPLQVNLVADRPALRFEHHPLEVGPCSPPATHSHSHIHIN